MITASLHPCDVGDLPSLIQLSRCFQHLPIDDRNLQSNWKTRFPFVKRENIGGLWLDIKEADQWLDARGKKLLSPSLLADKKKRNPGWAPAGDRLEALVSAQDRIVQKIAEIVALKLHANQTEFAKFVGGAA
jgi:hypothetical protein